MSPDDNDRLLHMLEAARLAQGWTAGTTLEKFRGELKLAYACLYCFTIIGEAANHLSEKAAATLAELPLRSMIGMRHRVVHAYFSVDYRRIWDTIRDDLPQLIQALELALSY